MLLPNPNNLHTREGRAQDLHCTLNSRRVCVNVWVCVSVCSRMCGKAYVFMWFSKVYLYPGHAELWEEESVFTVYFHIEFHNVHTPPETLNKTPGTSQGGTVVDFTFQCRGMVSIPGWRVRIPHDLWPKNQNTNNRSNIVKNSLNGPHKKYIFKKAPILSFQNSKLRTWVEWTQLIQTQSHGRKHQSLEEKLLRSQKSSGPTHRCWP